MVEAQHDDAVGRAGRIEEGCRPIHGQVRPLDLLDLEHDPHVLALRPFEHFRKRWNPCPGEARIEAGSGIEAADVLEAEIGGEAAAVGGAVDGQVVQHDRLAVGRQHDVDLDRRRARRPWRPRRAGSVFSG